MLWSVAFERAGVVMGDLYFVDPNLDQGDEGAERGVRLELRIFEQEPLRGSVYSAVPISVGRPIWRVDLLETVGSEPGSLTTRSGLRRGRSDAARPPHLDRRGARGGSAGHRLSLTTRSGLRRGRSDAAQPRVDGSPKAREGSAGHRLSLNRAHHHPRFHGWEPTARVFDSALSADPVTWVGERLADIDGVLDDAKVGTDEIGTADRDALRAAAPMVVRQLDHLLGEVAAGRAGLKPAEHGDFVRAGWL